MLNTLITTINILICPKIRNTFFFNIQYETPACIRIACSCYCAMAAAEPDPEPEAEPEPHAYPDPMAEPDPRHRWRWVRRGVKPTRTLWLLKKAQHTN